MSEQIPAVQLEAWKTEWANRLGMSHWLIKIRYAEQRETGNIHCSAQVWPAYQAERATIVIVSGGFNEKETDEGDTVELLTEIAICHELLHLIFNPCLPNCETANEHAETLFERALWRTSRALVESKYLTAKKQGAT